jgi:hypothetical protein
MHEKARGWAASLARTQVDEQGWSVCTGLALHEVEQLLDWLERTGCSSHEFQLDDQGTTVRWRHDPPHPRQG